MEASITCQAQVPSRKHHVPGRLVSRFCTTCAPLRLTGIQLRHCWCYQNLLFAAAEIASRLHM
jgi:hypothetical protein